MKSLDTFVAHVRRQLHAQRAPSRLHPIVVRLSRVMRVGRLVRKSGGKKKRKGRETIVRHFLRTNFPALRTGFVATHGNPRGCERPRNKRIWIQCCKFLITAATRGDHRVRELAHSARKRALDLKPVQGRERERLFLASTMRRGIVYQSSKRAKQKGIQETLGTHMGMPSTEWKQEAHEIEQFINKLPLKLDNLRSYDGPAPNNSASYERTRKLGGTAAELARAHMEQEIMRVADKEAVTHARLENAFITLEHLQSSEELAWAEGQLNEIWKLIDSIHDETPPSVNRTPTIREINRFARSVFLRTDSSSMKYCAIAPLGKIRVITQHPAAEVQTARHLTSIWLSALARCSTTGAMLQGREVRLRRGRETAKLYSADFTKATDVIPHELGRFIGKKLNRKLELDPEWDRVVDRLFSPKEVGINSTNRGLHMGLGPSWIILSLCNMYAGHCTKAPAETHAICGDDLIGLWTSTEAERYDAACSRLGLVKNTKKSFFARSGVFCERLVTRTSGTTAVCKDIGHYGETFASHSTEANDRNRWAVAANLPSSGFLKRHNRETVHRLTRLAPKGGRIAWGGSGGGTMSLGGLKQLAANGPLTLGGTRRYGKERRPGRPETASSLPHHLNEVVLALSNRDRNSATDISTRSLRVFLQSALELKQRWREDATSERNDVRFSSANHKRRREANKAPTTINSVLVSIAGATRSTNRNRHSATYYVKKSISSSSPYTKASFLRRAARILARAERETFVDSSLAEEVVHSIWPLDIAERAKRASLQRVTSQVNSASSFNLLAGGDAAS